MCFCVYIYNFISFGKPWIEKDNSKNRKEMKEEKKLILTDELNDIEAKEVDIVLVFIQTMKSLGRDEEKKNRIIIIIKYVLY